MDAATRAGEANGRAVVLVHGIFDTPRILRRMSVHLAGLGFRPLAPRLTPRSAACGLEKLAHQLKAFIDEQVPDGERFDLVGFSMGGLVGRHYIQRMAGIGRVRRFISISSPHHGSYMAYALWNQGCRDMRPGSEFLRELNREAAMLARVGFVSIWSPMDLMIVPAKNSRLGVGEEFTLPVPFHPMMAMSRRSVELVGRLLREKCGPG